MKNFNLLPIIFVIGLLITLPMAIAKTNIPEGFGATDFAIDELTSSFKDLVHGHTPSDELDTMIREAETYFNQVGYQEGHGDVMHHLLIGKDRSGEKVRMNWNPMNGFSECQRGANKLASATFFDLRHSRVLEGFFDIAVDIVVTVASLGTSASLKDFFVGTLQAEGRAKLKALILGKEETLPPEVVTVKHRDDCDTRGNVMWDRENSKIAFVFSGDCKQCHRGKLGEFNVRLDADVDIVVKDTTITGWLWWKEEAIIYEYNLKNYYITNSANCRCIVDDGIIDDPGEDDKEHTTGGTPIEPDDKVLPPEDGQLPPPPPLPECPENTFDIESDCSSKCDHGECTGFNHEDINCYKCEEKCTKGQFYKSGTATVGAVSTTGCDSCDEGYVCVAQTDSCFACEEKVHTCPEGKYISGLCDGDCKSNECKLSTSVKPTETCYECVIDAPPLQNCAQLGLLDSSLCDSCTGDHECKPTATRDDYGNLCYDCVEIPKDKCSDFGLIDNNDCDSCSGNTPICEVTSQRDGYGITCYECVEEDVSCESLDLKSSCNSCTGDTPECESTSTKDSDGNTCYNCVAADEPASDCDTEVMNAVKDISGDVFYYSNPSEPITTGSGYVAIEIDARCNWVKDTTDYYDDILQVEYSDFFTSNCPVTYTFIEVDTSSEGTCHMTYKFGY